MTSSVQVVVNKLLMGKDYLIIDSSKRSSGVAEDFEINFGRTISDIKSIKPLMAIITNRMHNVSRLTNILSISKNGIITSKALPTGNYQVQELISTLNQVWDSELRFTYDEKTEKITIDSLEQIPVPFLLDVQNSTMLQVLGFSPNYNFGFISSSHVSDSIVSIKPYEFLNVCTDTTKQYYSSTYREYLTSFTIGNIQFGDSDVVLFPDLEIPSIKSFLTSMRIYITDKNFKTIDNNNADWLLYLQINFLK